MAVVAEKGRGGSRGVDSGGSSEKAEKKHGASSRATETDRPILSV